MTSPTLVCDAPSASIQKAPVGYIPRPLAVSAICVICGNEFSYERKGRGRRRNTCSDECKQKRSRDYVDPDKAKAYNTRRLTEVIASRACVVCGKPFEVKRANPDTEACGSSCGSKLATTRALLSGKHVGFPRIFADAHSANHHMNSMRRLRLLGAKPAIPERVNSTDIFARDNWRCGICHKKVNSKLKWPHPMSAALDHIIPISRGGIHSAVNLQCAHFSCNSRKCAGSGGQLRLFG